MQLLPRYRSILAAMCAAVAVTLPIQGASFEWTGAGSDLFWITSGNWNPSGPPGAADEARFLDTGAGSDLLTSSAVVSASTTIERLWVGPTTGVFTNSVNPVHHIRINPGVTLTVAGTADNGNGPLGSVHDVTNPMTNVLSTFYVGTKREVAVATTVTNVISGGGTLALDNPNNELNVRQNWGAGGGDHWAVLDMSGLNTFTANLGRMRIGDGERGQIRRAQGLVRLALTNNITLSGPNFKDNVQLVVGNNDENNNGMTRASLLFLGLNNTLNIDEILIGGRKQDGRMLFNPDMVSPTLKLRGADGVGRIRAFRVGDTSDQIGSTAPAGYVDFSAGTVDILADTIILGKGQESGGGGTAAGTMTLGAGTVDVNALELAYHVHESANHNALGVLNLDGTTVTVNDLLRLGRSAGAPATLVRTSRLNLSGNSAINVLGTYTNNGVVHLNITNSSLSLPAGARISADTINLDGGAISNAAVVTVTNVLNLINGSRITGNPMLDLGSTTFASWYWDSPQTISSGLAGNGFITGDVTMAPGSMVVPGAAGVAGSLYFNSAVTLNGANLSYDLTSDGTQVAFGSDYMSVGGNLTLSGVNNVSLRSLSGSLDTGNNYTLINYVGALTGGAANLQVVGPLASSRYTFAFVVGSGAVQLDVGGSGAANLTWVGDGTSNEWQAQGAAIWRNGLALDQFFSLDAVTFDDTGLNVPNLNLVGELVPGMITVNNAAKNYTFGGSGSIAASGPLTKSGAASLTFGNGANSFGGTVTNLGGALSFSNSGMNNFSGGLVVSAGSAAFSGDNSNTFTPSAATFSPYSLEVEAGSSVTMSNSGQNNFGTGGIRLDGTLTLNTPADMTIGGNIGGGGTLVKGNSNVLTLGGNNSGLFTEIALNAGTIKMNSATAVGSFGVVIAEGAALDFNGRNASVPLTVRGSGPSGAGALLSTGAGDPGSTIVSVTLAGNTSIGGVGPWNPDPVANPGRVILSGILSTESQARNLSKVGSNQLTLLNSTIDAALADIDIQGGVVLFQGSTDSMGNPDRDLTVRAGATLAFFDTTTPWNKRIHLFGDGIAPTLFNWNGAHTIVGPVTLNGNVVVSEAPSVRGPNVVSITLDGVVGGSGGITKISPRDNLILTAANTYTGDTAINGGRVTLSGSGAIASSARILIGADGVLDVTQRGDGALTLGAGQTLGGGGLLEGNLTAGAGTTVAPGASIGSLTVSGTATLGGTTAMELNAASATSDLLTAQSITFGGTLDLSNLAGSLNGGAAFKLFEAASYSGTFSSIQPATPGAGLTWDTSELYSAGILKVVGEAAGGQPEIGSVAITAGNIVITGSGDAGAGYEVRASGDVSLPLAQWAVVTEGTFEGNGNFTASIPVNAENPQQFYIIRRK